MKPSETIILTVSGGLIVAGIVSLLTAEYDLSVSLTLMFTGILLVIVETILSFRSRKGSEKAKKALLSQVRSEIKVAYDEARTYHEKGLYGESIDCIDRVLPKARSQQEKFLLKSLRGNGLFMLESYDEAEREYLDCYDMSDSVPDVKAKGVCFLNLGIVLTRRGLYRRAHGPLEKALAIFEKHGTNHDIGKALLNLGSLYAHTGNLKKGFRYLKRARSRVIASFSKDDIALLLKVLGPLYRQAGKPFWFMLFSQSAYQWYRIAGNKRGMADELCNIAIALKDLGHRDLASGALRECLALSNEIKYYTGMGASFVNLASILQESEEFDEAIQWIENALSEFQRTGHWVGYITCLGLLGDWNRNRENPENAIEYHKKALVLSDKIGYHKGVRVSTYALLEDFRSLSQVDKFLHVVEPFLVKYPDIRNEVENWTSRE